MLQKSCKKLTYSVEFYIEFIIYKCIDLYINVISNKI